MKASKKFLKARTSLVLDHPFFGSIALRLRVLEDPTCQSMWVDGKTMGYNPKFVDTLTLDETIFIVCHEVMHLVLMHDIRRGDRDHTKWNMAGDYSINWIVREAGFKFPKGAAAGLINEEHKDASADFYYNLLPDPIKMSMPMPGEGNGEGKGKSGEENNSSGSDKNKGVNFDGNIGEVRDQPNPAGEKASNADKNQQIQERRIDIAQAVQHARKAGNLPGNLSRLVEDIIEPKLDWKTILHRFVQKAAKSDYAWSPPNRRYIHMGLYLPSMHSQEIDGIVLAIDTSGSIRPKDLAQFASELTAILESFETTLDVLHCDTDVRKHERFGRDDLPLKLELYGGGGTRFSPVFDWIKDQNKAPACLIYLTDLESNDFPDYPPDYPTLWIKTRSYGETPPFGEIVEL